MGTSTSALSDHIKGKHLIQEDIDKILARAQNHTALQAWMAYTDKDLPSSFKEGLLD
jgi:hypothetical protein